MFDSLEMRVEDGGGRSTGVNPPPVPKWMQTLHVLLGTVRCHCEISIPGGQEIKHTGVEVNVLHLQLLSTVLLCPFIAKNLQRTVGVRLCL